LLPVDYRASSFGYGFASLSSYAFFNCSASVISFFGAGSGLDSKAAL